MKCAFILYPSAVISGASNGIRQQAKTWAAGLLELGHQVEFVDTWGSYDWSDYDVIHIFGGGQWLDDFVERLSGYNSNIVLSPIIDSNRSYFSYGVSCRLGVDRLQMYTHQFAFARAARKSCAVLARSEHERGYITKSMGLFAPKVHLVRLGVRALPEVSVVLPREDFCLHVSSYSQPRKNVLRLIEACAKSGRKLVIAGNPGEGKLRERVERAASNYENIELLGFVSDERLSELYSTARVFCLPSLREGVGLVGLEAAAKGCDVVVTSRGGPADYFGEHGVLVDPLSVESIKSGIETAFEVTRQPLFKAYVERDLSQARSVDNLLKVYISLGAL